jgi:hypothetical protein
MRRRSSASHFGNVPHPWTFTHYKAQSEGYHELKNTHIMRYLEREGSYAYHLRERDLTRT